jgi:23S rRNA pseudouridine955/2504/2580 synthase
VNNKSKIKILYEDAHVIAINKPPRVASVPAKEITLSESAMGMLRIQFMKNNIDIVPYPLHRLDFATSGVMLFGKDEKDREILRGIFKHPATQKKYVALVKGVPVGRFISIPISARGSEEKIPARTIFKIIQTFKSPSPLCSLVEAEIETGRKHQIRKHFAEIGCPVILDSKYGDEHFNRKFRIRYRLGRQALHALSISFFHPILKKQIKIDSPLPPDLVHVLNKLSNRL